MLGVCSFTTKQLDFQFLKSNFAIHKCVIFTLQATSFILSQFGWYGRNKHSVEWCVNTQRPERQGAGWIMAQEFSMTMCQRFWKQNDQRGCWEQRAGKERNCREKSASSNPSSLSGGHHEEKVQRCFCPQWRGELSQCFIESKNRCATLLPDAWQNPQEKQLEKKKLPLTLGFRGFTPQSPGSITLRLQKGARYRSVCWPQSAHSIPEATKEGRS